jgi:hypothetical protein
MISDVALRVRSWSALQLYKREPNHEITLTRNDHKNFCAELRHSRFRTFINRW